MPINIMQCNDLIRNHMEFTVQPFRGSMPSNYCQNNAEDTDEIPSQINMVFIDTEQINQQTMNTLKKYF